MIGQTQRGPCPIQSQRKSLWTLTYFVHVDAGNSEKPNHQQIANKNKYVSYNIVSEGV
jgi:hypothetical protein